MRQMVALIRADLGRKADGFGAAAVVLVRLSQGLPQPLGGFFRVLLRVGLGADIPRSVRIGPGLRLPHGGSGVVIHPNAKIGANCVLYHGVTLGVSGRDQAAPVLDDRVYVGTGAAILGGVKLGFRSRVGANATVLTDVPAYSTAVGARAAVIERDAPEEWAGSSS